MSVASALFGTMVAKLGCPAGARRSIDVGWAIAEKAHSLIWEDVQPFRRHLEKPASAKSVQVCPAAVDFDARHFVVRCPIDINVRFGFDDKKQPMLQALDGAQSSVRPNHLNRMVSIVNRAEWRHPERPIVQFHTPYICLADEPVWINQLPPFLDYCDPAMPGILIAGRFPIHIWPRHLMWAFEWHDIRKPLVVARGAPGFYLRFETRDPSRSVRLVEADTAPVQDYIDSIAGVTNYVNRTFSLFERAQRRRPKQLLHAVRR
jgi:hypothetical protein